MTAIFVELFVVVAAVENLLGVLVIPISFLILKLAFWTKSLMIFACLKFFVNCWILELGYLSLGRFQ